VNALHKGDDDDDDDYDISPTTLNPLENGWWGWHKPRFALSAYCYIPSISVQAVSTSLKRLS
jgi:hypothetical protein